MYDENGEGGVQLCLYSGTVFSCLKGRSLCSVFGLLEPLLVKKQH